MATKKEATMAAKAICDTFSFFDMDDIGIVNIDHYGGWVLNISPATEIQYQVQLPNGYYLEAINYDYLRVVKG